jgi:hypothetical protein
MKIDTGTPVPENLYKADLEILDRYQGYSSELIRLSLLGIGALAFFLAQVALGEHTPASLKDWLAGLALGISALLFALSTACALSHRYHSTDGFTSHIKAIRSANAQPPEPSEALKHANLRNRIYKVSGWWLGAAVSLFGAGGFFFVFAVARLVYLWVSPG